MKKIRKILIIDDDSTTAFLHKRMLENMGVAEEIVYITNPFTALQHVHQHYANVNETTEGHDLIFLDIDMPGMDGFQFLIELKSLNLDQNVFSIVMLTTSIYAGDRKKADSFNDLLRGYMIKPLQKESVEVLVEALAY